MSQHGISIMAEVYALLQNRRIELLRLATEEGPVDTQDMLFAKLLSDMNDLTKNRFCEYTKGK